MNATAILLPALRTAETLSDLLLAGTLLLLTFEVWYALRLRSLRAQARRLGWPETAAAGEQAFSGGLFMQRRRWAAPALLTLTLIKTGLHLGAHTADTWLAQSTLGHTSCNHAPSHPPCPGTR